MKFILSKEEYLNSITEGLIRSSDIPTTLRICERFLKQILSSDKYCLVDNGSIIILKLLVSDLELYKEKINSMFVNISGWFPYEYIYYDMDDNELSTSKYMLEQTDAYMVEIYFEGKFVETEQDSRNLNYKYFYHVSPSIYKDKILTIGLVPKTKSKISYHPDRIYLTTSVNDCIHLAYQFNYPVGQFSIFKIENYGFKICKDIQYNNGYYVMNNISSKYITLI